MDWLANGLEDAFAEILKSSNSIVGAIYHLTDNEWVVPELRAFHGQLSIAYNKTSKDDANAPAVRVFGSKVHERTHANIMHDKFLVDLTNGRVLTGSANFTPEGITSQANVLHVFESKPLAELYKDRQEKLAANLTMAEISENADWSEAVKVGDADVRVFFSPEPGGSSKKAGKPRKSLDAVVQAVKDAKESVMFCMFSPTDPTLLEAMLAAGDHGKIMYGLLNSISDPNKKKKDQSASGEAPAKPSAATQIRVTLFNRSRKDKKVLAYDYFAKGNAPAGFLPEFNTVDMSSKNLGASKTKTKPNGKSGRVPAVHIHHKFIIIDAETENPIIYTGSNNMSQNSTYHNDENLVEIKHCPRLAQIYLAEFFRLYEHFRARALWHRSHPPGQKTDTSTLIANKKLQKTFTLATTRNGWVKDAYKKGTPEYLMRIRLSQGLAKSARHG